MPIVFPGSLEGLEVGFGELKRAWVLGSDPVIDVDWRLGFTTTHF